MSDTKRDDNELRPIVNKIANSGLVTINLEDFIPTEILALDVKDFLFQGLLLKEKDFKEKLTSFNWEDYKNKPVAIFCSTDALVQQWAFMMLVRELSSVTSEIYQGTIKEVQEKILLNNIEKIPNNEYLDKRVIVKGCGHQSVTDAAFIEITKKLLPFVKSLMYGEACSNVPIYKK